MTTSTPTTLTPTTLHSRQSQSTTEKKSAIVRLDAFQSDNWSHCDTPVAILNDESTMHERIAFAWGLSNQLRVLADILAQHEDTEIRQVAELFNCQLQPLESMLRKLGLDTQPNE